MVPEDALDKDVTKDCAELGTVPSAAAEEVDSLGAPLSEESAVAFCRNERAGSVAFDCDDGREKSLAVLEKVRGLSGSCCEEGTS